MLFTSGGVEITDIDKNRVNKTALETVRIMRDYPKKTFDEAKLEAEKIINDEMAIKKDDAK